MWIIVTIDNLNVKMSIKYMQATKLSLSKVSAICLSCNVMARKNMHLLRLIQWF